MSNPVFSKFTCSLMIGVFVPLGAACAADDHDRLQSHLGDGSPTQYFSYGIKDAQNQPMSTSEGAQGPVRSDMSTGDKRSDSEKDAAWREMQKRYFPLNAEGG